MIKSKLFHISGEMTGPVFFASDGTREWGAYHEIQKVLEELEEIGES